MTQQAGYYSAYIPVTKLMSKLNTLTMETIPPCAITPRLLWRSHPVFHQFESMMMFISDDFSKCQSYHVKYQPVTEIYFLHFQVSMPTFCWQGGSEQVRIGFKLYEMSWSTCGSKKKFVQSWWCPPLDMILLPHSCDKRFGTKYPQSRKPFPALGMQIDKYDFQ